MEQKYTDFSTLRRRNKAILVERAFTIFAPPEHNTSEHRESWIERLVEGHCAHAFIHQLKHGQVIPEAKSTPEQEQPPEAMGRLRVIDDNLTLHAGLKRKLRIRIENFTDRALQTTPEEPLYVAYHWYRADGEVYEFEGERTPLPQPAVPGTRMEMAMKLMPPDEAGEYRLMVTMVHEGCCWMEEAGMDVHVLNFTVQDYDGRGLSRHALSVFKQFQAVEAEVGH
ncbi:hypothetical protein [Ectothiorhodospira shaposhnikovii]|uniref:hypothetical protein n=1 Tax=Ectothiorhodospira shaposhnikovii TaxID=1054 RepID=UPI0039A1E1E5